MKLSLDDVKRLMHWALDSKNAAKVPDADLLRRLRQEAQRIEVGLGYAETTVTPTMAKQWLKNALPIHLSDDMIDQYAVIMRNGRWRLEPTQPLQFDATGRLVDGQHRLYACIKANRSFPSAVVHVSDPVVWSQTNIRNNAIAERAAERVATLPERSDVQGEILRSIYQALAENAKAA